MKPRQNGSLLVGPNLKELLKKSKNTGTSGQHKYGPGIVKIVTSARIAARIGQKNS